MRPALLASPGRPQRWRYRYANRLRAPVDLWVSLPLRRPGQDDVRLSLVEGVPAAGWRMSVDGAAEVAVDALATAAADPAPGTVNLLARYRVPPGGRVRVEAEYTSSALRLADAEEARRLEARGWHPLPPPPPLTLAERAYWLRSTPLVRTGAEVAAEAAALAEDGARGGGGELAVLERLFDRLVSDAYGYRWPPPDRGSEAMRATKSGDCGQYSFLLAAWARSLGIPARVVVGSWATGRMQAHVWNEVFVEGVGWVPVDASTAALVRVEGDMGPLVQMPAGEPSRPRPAFWLGGLDGGRMVFSVDADPHGLPGYPAAEAVAAVEAGESMSVAGRSFRWGRELLDGRVPYLQPAYPFFPVDPGNVGDEMLLGDWRFRTPAGRAVAGMLAMVALVVGLGAFVLGAMQVALGAFIAMAVARHGLGHARPLNLAVAGVLAAGLLFRLIQ